MVRCAVLYIACDLPAARKTCRFLGHLARLGCSKCFKQFPAKVGSMDYSGFDHSQWIMRTDIEHRKRIDEIRKCKTKTEQARKESSLGCRFSVFLDLPYFDATRLLAIDPVHNLYLGSGKRMLSLWIESGLLSSTHFHQIQSFVDSISLPSDIGRIPHKISSGFVSFKADQFKTWITLYSIPALHGIPYQMITLSAGVIMFWRVDVCANRLCQMMILK